MSTYTFNGVTYDSADLTGSSGRGYNDTVVTGTGDAVPRYIAPMVDVRAEVAAARDATVAVVAGTPNSTSTTSLTVGLGSKSLTLTDLNKPLAIGMWGKLVSAADTTKWMWGTITAFTGGTGATTFNITQVGSSGATASDWNVVITGPGGVELVNEADPTLSNDLDAAGFKVNNVRSYNHGFNIDGRLKDGLYANRWYFGVPTRIFKVNRKCGTGSITAVFSKNGSTDINFGVSPSTSVSVTTSLTESAVNQGGNAYIDFAAGDFMAVTFSSNSSAENFFAQFDAQENYI
jgi:hypothetical protein